MAKKFLSIVDGRPKGESIAIDDVTSLQSSLDGKVATNTAITGATKTKITYDAKGLVTSGADATTADIADSLNKRYVTDTEKSTWNAKQAPLVSGTDIKTINSTSLLGAGNIVVGGETANVETLSADKTLTASDAPIQIYTCTSNRVVNLPTTGLAVGQKFRIVNLNASNTSLRIEVRASGAAMDHITAVNSTEFVWSGSVWTFPSRYAVKLGGQSLASNYGVAMGYQAFADYQGVAIGATTSANAEGLAVGYNADINNLTAIALGPRTKCERTLEIISTASTNKSANHSQVAIQKFRQKDLSTAAAAWQELFIDGSSARLTIIASSVYHFRIQINAIDTSNFNVKTWTLEGAIRRNASNGTAIIGTVVKVVTSADAATTNWDVQATADDTNEALKIEVKHDSANQVRYSLNIWATETRI